MASNALPDRVFTLLIFILFQASTTIAQISSATASTPAISQTPTSTTQSSGSAQTGNGDGGGIPAAAAAPTSQAGANAVGASGGAGGSINLSQGSTIAIAVVVSLVVLLGATSAILYFVAKKRQWKVRESIRRSVRRVTDVVRSPLSPRTPSRMEFPKTPARSTKDRTVNRTQSQREPPASRPVMTEKRPQATQIVTREKPAADLEKGLARPTIAPLKIPQSSFDMDSPASGVSNIWTRMFGRK